MNQNRRRVLVLLFTCILAGGALYAFMALEPSYQGQSLSEWLSNLDSFAERSKYEQAELAIQNIGTNAIPHLLHQLEARDSALQKKLFYLSLKQHWIKFHFVNENRRHQRAIFALKALGTNATPALPALIAWVEGKDVNHQDFATRLRAMAVLRELGPVAHSAAPALLSALQSPDQNIRSNAALALGNITTNPSLVVPALISAVSDPDPITRGNSVASLARFGEQARPAIPALEQALQDPNNNVRSLAVYALQTIEPQRKNGTPEWRALWQTNPQISQP